MKKTRHVVYSTKTVAKKAVQQQQQQHEAEQPPRRSSGVATTDARRYQDTITEKQDQQGNTTASSRKSPTATSSSSTSSVPKHSPSSSRHHRTDRKHRISTTVKRLRPSQALLQSDQITVAQCVKTMVEKKTEATLLIDKNGLLTGILTDRDIACKVVAIGKRPKFTRVSDVMTPNPSCVASNASAIDALKQMVSGQFRHLPVADNEKVVGILDIAKCLYEAITKIEHAYDVSSQRLSNAVKKLERHMAGSAGDNLFETLRQKLFLPTLSAILMEGSEVPILRPSSTAMEAAQLMLTKKTSAGNKASVLAVSVLNCHHIAILMVCNEAGDMVGIFTSKDLMRRVVAVDLDPTTCLLSTVMTANPYSAKLGTTILETLHSMHNGRFLHVPVFDDGGKLVGLVDVLQVTCGVVQQMGTFQLPKNENVEPLWDRFRDSLISTDESGDADEPDDGPDGQEGGTDGDDIGTNTNPTTDTTPASLIGRETWSEYKESHNVETDPTQADNPLHEPQPDVFVYKLADCYGNNHRFTSSAESVKDLLRDVQNRLGDYTIRKVHYIDDEGDHVLLFKDDDLKDAVHRARMWGNKYIRLVVPHRVSRLGERPGGLRPVFAHGTDTALGIVYYAAAAAAIAGASFFLSRRR